MCKLQIDNIWYFNARWYGTDSKIKVTEFDTGFLCITKIAIINSKLQLTAFWCPLNFDMNGKICSIFLIGAQK